MKKISMQGLIFACLLLFMTGCQKSMQETTEEATAESTLSQMTKAKQLDPKKNECQLTFGYDDGGFPNYFHYNSVGLVDEWRVDRGGGAVYNIKMTYDNKNRLSTASLIDPFGGFLVSIDFVWAEDRITLEHWDVGGFFQFDFINTYDKRGNIIKRESSYGLSTIIEFSPQGNYLRYVSYMDGVALQSDEYTYNKSNKNPFNAIPGLPYPFLYTGAYVSKWYATSDKFTVYENGNPIVLFDTDPAKTVMEFGPKHYLSSATYYDRVSKTFTTRTFEYQNCGPQSNMPGKINGPPSNSSLNRKGNRHGPMIIISHDKIRKRMEKIKKQKA
jgi:hypothetical protein